LLARTDCFRKVSISYINVTALWLSVRTDFPILPLFSWYLSQSISARLESASYLRCCGRYSLNRPRNRVRRLLIAFYCKYVLIRLWGQMC